MTRALLTTWCLRPPTGTERCRRISPRRLQSLRAAVGPSHRSRGTDRDRGGKIRQQKSGSMGQAGYAGSQVLASDLPGKRPADAQLKQPFPDVARLAVTAPRPNITSDAHQPPAHHRVPSRRPVSMDLAPRRGTGSNAWPSASGAPLRFGEIIAGDLEGL